MNVLDLFSGIGGFSLGLERAGMRIVAFCEIDPYCRAVLARHWPGVPIHGDIRALTPETLADAKSERVGLCGDDGGSAEGCNTPPGRFEALGSGSAGVDVICGGFPCQDISVAGKGAGLAGARSGLWREYHRLIRELRPRYVIVENVSALLSQGLGEVLGDLAEIGYDAEWHCIPASYVGAPHRRDRVWIVAYPNGGQVRGVGADSGDGREIPPEGPQRLVRGSDGRPDVADADIQGLEIGFSGSSGQAAHGAAERQDCLYEWWESEPDVGRVAHGVPARVDRLRALGNAVVPQVVEIIGRAIMRAET